MSAGVELIAEFLSYVKDQLFTWLPLIFLGLLVYFFWRMLAFMPRVKPTEVEPDSKSAVGWDDIPGASLKNHPAPFPLEIPSRLIRMFSFVGDTVLDPFAGSGTTAQVALELGHRAILIELNPEYVKLIHERCAPATEQSFAA